MKSLKSNLKEKIYFLKLKSGDSEAFGFFYDQYVGQIYRFIMMKVSDVQVAQDLTQDVFLKIWQHFVDQKKMIDFRAFIFRVARNVVIDYYRQNNKSNLPLEQAEEVADEGLVLDKQLAIKLEADSLLQILQTLKPEYQEILTLRFVEEMSFDEIAEILQKDKNNIRVTLHRALSKLKQLTEKNNFL